MGETCYRNVRYLSMLIAQLFSEGLGLVQLSWPCLPLGKSPPCLSCSWSYIHHFWSHEKTTICFKQSPVAFNRWGMFFSVGRYSASLLPMMRMLSVLITTHGIPFNKLSMALWKISGADNIPYDNWLYWYNPFWVLIVVNFVQSSYSLICWYTSNMSSLLNFWPQNSASKSSAHRVG